MSKQGGNMVIDTMIVMLVLGCLATIYLVKKYNRQPSTVAVENAKSLESLFSHIERLEQNIQHLRSTKANADSVASVANQISNALRVRITGEINECKKDVEDAQEHLARVREEQQRLWAKIGEIPKEIRIINKTQELPLKHQGMEVRGYEWLTVKKGKRVKAVKYWTVPSKAKGIRRIDLPGAEDAKTKLVEAGL